MTAQTVRIYCRGKPTTATLRNDCLDWHCDRCGNRIRRVVVWNDASSSVRQFAKRKARQ